MLKLAGAEPTWLDILPGVRVLMRPIGIKAVRAARAAIRASYAEDAGDDEGAADALSAELIRRGVVEWEGVGDAEGEVLPVTPESIELFVADPTTFEATDRAYVLPWAKRDQEKNASAPSPSGTSAGATQADNIATSPVGGETTDAAKAIGTLDEKPAPTSPTSSKPKRQKASGK